MGLIRLFSWIALYGYSLYKEQQANSSNEITYSGIFEGRKIFIGNYKEEVYKIGDYYIALSDISLRRVKSLKGKRILVSGKRERKTVVQLPVKPDSNRIIHEQFSEPDIIFIKEPIFQILS